MSTSAIVKTIFLAAPPQAVWDYLTDKDKLGTWYHPAKDTLAPDADYTLIKKGESAAVIWGKVLAFDPPRKLVTTFCIPPFGEKETTVTWDLNAVTGGTRLTVTHEGVAEAAGDAAFPMLSALDVGWDEHLGDLRKKIAA